MSIEIKDVITNNRKKVNMTQDELARSLNVSNKVISNWETGRSYPDVLIIPELAKVLQIDVKEFFTEEISKSSVENKELVDITAINNFRKYMYIANLLAVFANVYIFIFFADSIVQGIMMVLTIMFILFSIGLNIIATLNYGNEVLRRDTYLYLKLNIVYFVIWFCNINLLFLQMTHLDIIRNTLVILIYFGLVYYLVKKTNLKLKFNLGSKLLIIALSLLYMSTSFLVVFQFITYNILPQFFFALLIFAIIIVISMIIMRAAEKCLGKK